MCQPEECWIDGIIRMVSVYRLIQITDAIWGTFLSGLWDRSLLPGNHANSPINGDFNITIITKYSENTSVFITTTSKIQCPGCSSNPRTVVYQMNVNVVNGILTESTGELVMFTKNCIVHVASDDQLDEVRASGHGCREFSSSCFHFFQPFSGRDPLQEVLYLSCVTNIRN